LRLIRFFAISTLFSTLWAQAPTGDITGTVTDATGAIVAGATVTIKNTATNAQRTATSNEAGAYNIPSLPPGPYTVRVEMKGFTSQVRSDIELQAGQVARLDLYL